MFVSASYNYTNQISKVNKMFSGGNYNVFQPIKVQILEDTRLEPWNINANLQSMQVPMVEFEDPRVISQSSEEIMVPHDGEDLLQTPRVSFPEDVIAAAVRKEPAGAVETSEEVSNGETMNVAPCSVPGTSSPEAPIMPVLRKISEVVGPSKSRVSPLRLKRRPVWDEDDDLIFERLPTTPATVIPKKSPRRAPGGKNLSSMLMLSQSTVDGDSDCEAEETAASVLRGAKKKLREMKDNHKSKKEKMNSEIDKCEEELLRLSSEVKRLSKKKDGLRKRIRLVEIDEKQVDSALAKLQ